MKRSPDFQNKRIVPAALFSAVLLVGGCAHPADAPAENKAPARAAAPAKTTPRQAAHPKSSAHKKQEHPRHKHKAAPAYDGPYKRDMEKPLKPTGGEYDIAKKAIDLAEADEFKKANIKVDGITNPKLRTMANRSVQLLLAADIVDNASYKDEDEVKADLRKIQDVTAYHLAEKSIMCEEDDSISSYSNPYKYGFFYGWNPLTRRYEYHYGSHYDPDLALPEDDPCDDGYLESYEFVGKAADISHRILLHSSAYAAEYAAAR